MDAATARHLATLRAGRSIDPAFANGKQAQAAIRIFTEEGGSACTGGVKELYRKQYQLDKEFAKHFKAEYPDAHYVTRSECAQVVALALDEYHGEAMTATEAGLHVFGEQHGAACMKRNITAKALRAGLVDNVNHAGYQALVRLNGRREVSKQANGGTMSGLYNSLVNGAKVVKRLEALERNQADMLARLAELEAFKAQQQARNVVEDAGTDPRTEARTMRTDGKSYGEIAKVLGRSRATVQTWCKGI